MYTRVTLPVDTENPDIEAIAIASSMARRLNLPLDLITVSSEQSVAAKRTALGNLTAVPGVKVTTRVLVARDIEDALYSDAREHPGAIWCVPTHAKWAMTESLVGSISDDFVRDIGSAVVLVGPHAVRTVTDDAVILVAIDGKPASEAILPSAVKLAKALHLGLRVVEVIDTTKVPAGHVSEEANAVRHIVRDWADSGVSIDFEVLHGSHPATAIVDYVAQNSSVVLVAMATLGLPAQARVVYPSETYRVVRHAVCPVVVLHPIPTFARPERRNVVVAGVDDVTRSPEVIDVAALEAASRGAVLLLLHTWENPVYVGGEFAMAYPVYADDQMEEAQLATLDAAVEVARRKAPRVEVVGAIAKGRAADILVDYSHTAEVIVVGQHAHSAFTEALMGSVARSVGRRSSCPVIVVPCVSHASH